MRTQTTPLKQPLRPAGPLVRLEPIREGYFPDLDDDFGELEDPHEAVARVSLVTNPQQGRRPMETRPDHSRIPSRVFNEVLNGNYEPSLAARLAARFQTGTPAFNEAYVCQRAIQIEQAARPDPGYCAISASPPPPAEAVVRRVPRAAMAHNPWVLNRPSDVLGIFGLGFLAWIALEMLSVGCLAWGLTWLLPDLKELAWAGCAGLALLADWGLWIRVRGRIYTHALRPGLVVLSLLSVSGIAAATFRFFSSGIVQWGSSGPPATF